MVKWGGQEVRTSAKRDFGKDCEWPKEELALIVRTRKQLQEPVEVEVSGLTASKFRDKYWLQGHTYIREEIESNLCTQRQVVLRSGTFSTKHDSST